MNKLLAPGLLAVCLGAAAGLSAQAPGKGVQRCPGRSPSARCHHHRRKALHLLRMAVFIEEAGAVSPDQRRRDHRYARLSTRAACRRTSRPPASRRPVVQLRQCQRLRFLEQLRRHQAGRPRQDGIRFTIRRSFPRRAALEQGELAVDSVWTTGQNRRFSSKLRVTSSRVGNMPESSIWS